MKGVAALECADRALLVEGSLRASRNWYAIAHQQACAAGDVVATARAALGLSGLWVHEDRLAASAAAVEAYQQAALAALPPDSPLALRLRARLAAEADYRSGRSDRVRSALERARGSEAVAHAEALSLAHHCLLGPDDAAARVELAEELMRVAAHSGRPVDGLMGLLWSTVDRYLLGDPMADRWLAQLRVRIQGERHEAVGYVLDAMLVMRALRAGRLAEAEALAASCAQAGEVAGDADANGWYAAQIIVIRWYQGRSAELRPQLLALADAPSTGAVDVASFSGLAVAHAMAGDLTLAACALARARGRDFDGIVRGSSWLVAMYASVEAAHLLGDAETSRAAYAALVPFAELPVMASLAVACLGSAQHPLGMAALTAGDTDAAVHHLRAALRANQSLGHLPAAALTRHRLGQALSQRGLEPDRQEAAAHLTKAAAEARALGLALPDVSAPSIGVRHENDPVDVARHSDRLWTVRHGERVAVVPDSTGMRYLALLAQRPGVGVEALELVQATIGGDRTSGRQPARHELVDRQALRAYRLRLAELEDEVHESTSRHDDERAARARAERDWILDEIGAVSGLGGGVRAFTDDAERARIAVTKAIRRAVERVRAADPTLGELLANRIRTGGRCCLDAA
jgi:hypothetical protein